MSTIHPIQAGMLLQARYAGLQQKQQPINASSIETTVSTATNNTSIELPQEIKALTIGSDYWVTAKSNRYKKLIREGHLDKLLTIAAMARTKDNPAHWYATSCSKAMWERTLAYLTKTTEVAHKAEAVARRIGVRVNKFIYKQIWKGVNVERWAIAAEELPHRKPGQSKAKHFAWLCLHEQFLTSQPLTC